MAALLAASTTEPPLSVALMGNWGSGKSTFMGLVSKRVAALGELAERFPGETAWVGPIRQVRFNAWHYSDDHLWVGLVEHLFRELRDASDAVPLGQDAERARKEAELANVNARKAYLDQARIRSMTWHASTARGAG